MMCYRDMTFCGDAPTGESRDGCHRHFTQKDHESAVKWLGSENYPVAFGNFAEICEYYEDAPKLDATT